MKFQKLLGVTFLCFLVHFSTQARTEVSGIAKPLSERFRKNVLRNSYGTYCAAPRLPNGRIDVQRLIAELVELHANTYSWCIHQAATDWDDLQLFLPLAKQKKIRVWASIVPPSESPPHSKLFAEPFKLDYERWAKEFATLSLRETALVAWSIDDFTHNLKVFTPEHLKKMLEGARQINPKLAFVPCCYYKSITPQFAKNYGDLLDGILFPYRNESKGANLTDPTSTESEVKKIKTLVPSLPVLIDVYASAHSRLGKSTPEYVEQVMTGGKQSADGVMIYCHQNREKNPEKYQIIERLFRKWSK